jgi:cell division protein FtsB
MTSKTQETMKCEHEFIDLFHREFCSKCKKFKSDLQPEAQPQQEGEMPEDVRRKVNEHINENCQGGRIRRRFYTEGAEWMYKHLQSQLSTLTAENAKLKEENEDLKYRNGLGDIGLNAVKDENAKLWKALKDEVKRFCSCRMYQCRRNSSLQSG